MKKAFSIRCHHKVEKEVNLFQSFDLVKYLWMYSLILGRSKVGQAKPQAGHGLFDDLFEGGCGHLRLQR